METGTSRDSSKTTLTRPISTTSEATSGLATSSTLSSATTTYSRDALNRDLMEGFRQQQKAARDRQVERLALAKGLGEPAVASLKEGLYNPRKVLPPLRPEEKKLFERMDLKDWRTSRQVSCGQDTEEKKAPPSATPRTSTQQYRGKEGGTAACGDAKDAAAPAVVVRSPSAASTSSTSSDDLKENCPGAVKTFLKQLRATNRATITLYDGQAEVEENINMVEAALSHQCSPLSFATLLDALSHALEAMERGYLTEDLCVPVCQDIASEREGEVRAFLQSAVAAAPSATALDAASPPSSSSPSPSAGPSPDAGPPGATTVVLHGAMEVEAYTRQFLLPKAYKAIAIAHAAEWMLQYTMAYLRTVEAVDMEEAQVRLVLLGRCVRLLGEMEGFSSVLLSLEAKSQEYAGFLALKETAETHLSTLLGEVESSLDAILGSPFPSRRSRLLLVEREMQKKLQRALLLLNEIDYSWTPTAHFHWAWKAQFLSMTFQRIHGAIAHKYMRCSMGFIDDALYDQVSDTRITGRYMGASPIQPKVARARQVEYEKVTEGLTLQQISMSVKGVASLVVGEQVCMGARYIVRQCTPEFDAAWGFHMDEVSVAPTEVDLQKKVAKVAAKARRQFSALPTKAKAQPSTTFLTQGE
jgi:hypothetical protein